MGGIGISGIELLAVPETSDPANDPSVHDLQALQGTIRDTGPCFGSEEKSGKEQGLSQAHFKAVFIFGEPKIL